MSFEWTSQPLSIQSIASQYTLPVAIRSAPGFHGSNHPVILYSISRVTFAFGRALRTSQSTTSGYTKYTPLDSEIIAIPMKYPGYFECLSSSHSGQHQTGVVADTNIDSIVERMQVDQRPQSFYSTSAMRVYTLELNVDGITNRVWHQIEPYQIILIEKIVSIEYTPTEDDALTDDDYELSWWFCFSKQILNRNEDALQCVINPQQICYISCSSTEEFNLIPVGQQGSSNVNKLQTIQNLIDRFPIPTNIKLAKLPGSYAYADFLGCLQLLGSRSEDLAVCASLTTSNIALIPKNTPLKFVVSPLSPSSSSQIRTALSSCHIFTQSFDMQIRRILMSSNYNNSSHRSRSRYAKTQSSFEESSEKIKRSNSVDQGRTVKNDQPTTATDEGYRSGTSAFHKRNNNRSQRTISANIDSSSHHLRPKRTSSTDDDTKSGVRSHSAIKSKQSSSLLPPPLPKKPANFPFPAVSSTSDHETSLTEDIDSANANGAILMDTSNELFLALPSDSRFT
ncbi:unnamed protein product [Rotaria magnacalcarata]|uniref:Uncharacterized protein n=1 Tax=Rotaria magnacalcarata TaxID=392030 RepID=A0A816W3K7_9BILA|nr:unnamed protein product [Rotaria magnacalcarata]CAF4172335.1 unnamed protein product [Rotaria magnacalcarata]